MLWRHGNSDKINLKVSNNHLLKIGRLIKKTTCCQHGGIDWNKIAEVLGTNITPGERIVNCSLMHALKPGLITGKCNIEAIQVLPNAMGGRGCQIFRKKRYRGLRMVQC